MERTELGRKLKKAKTALYIFTAQVIFFGVAGAYPLYLVFKAYCLEHGELNGIGIFGPLSVYTVSLLALAFTLGIKLFKRLKNEIGLVCNSCHVVVFPNQYSGRALSLLEHENKCPRCGSRFCL